MQQFKLAEMFGTQWAHADPDYRPEYNDDLAGWPD